MSRLLVESCGKSKGNIWNKFYPWQWTLLHLAAAANSVYVVKHALGNNPDWDLSTDGKEWSLVHIAARNGHVELLTYLLARDKTKQKSVMERTSSDGATPLFEASKCGEVQALSLLLQKGANIHVQNRDKMTALHTAALGGHAKTVERLLEDKKVNIVGKKTNQGETVLHLAVQYSHESCPDVIEAFRGHRIDIEATARFEINRSVKEKYTALHMAVENGNIEGTRKLLQLNANHNAETEEGDTALHLAARKVSMAIADVLLSENAKADKRNRGKATPLHEAIENYTETLDPHRDKL